MILCFCKLTRTCELTDRKKKIAIWNSSGFISFCGSNAKSPLWMMNENFETRSCMPLASGTATSLTYFIFGFVNWHNLISSSLLNLYSCLMGSTQYSALHALALYIHRKLGIQCLTISTWIPIVYSI